MLAVLTESLKPKFIAPDFSCYFLAMNKLLLLHGALGSAAQMQPLAEALSPHFDIHTLNFEGHGGAPFSGNHFSIAQFAEQVLDKIVQIGAEQVDIFGYSMGGYVGLYLARHYPERVGKIATLATKFNWNPESGAKEAAQLNPQKIKDKVPAFAAELQQRHTVQNWEKLLHQTAALLLNLGTQPELPIEQLALLNQPALIGVGDKDKMVSLEETIAAFRQLPKGQLMVLPDTQHPFERVNIKLLAKMMTRFFANE